MKMRNEAGSEQPVKSRPGSTAASWSMGLCAEPGAAPKIVKSSGCSLLMVTSMYINGNKPLYYKTVKIQESHRENKEGAVGADDGK